MAIHSSREITAFEAKTRLGRLLDRVENGEELIITRHGQPVARLIPAVHQDRSRVSAALATFSQVREELSRKGVKNSRKQIREWIDEGRA